MHVFRFEKTGNPMTSSSSGCPVLRAAELLALEHDPIEVGDR